LEYRITGFVIATFDSAGLLSVPFLVNRDWDGLQVRASGGINMGVFQKPCSVIANEVKQSVNILQ
jgi:hypothetical protein